MWHVHGHSFIYAIQHQDCFAAMARRIVPSSMGLGLSILLFIFMFLPTLIVLMAVVVFFLFVFPRLRSSPAH